MDLFDWISSYVDFWTRDGWSIGAILMLGISAVAALLIVMAVATGLMWTLVGVKRLFGGDVSGKRPA